VRQEWRHFLRAAIHLIDHRLLAARNRRLKISEVAFVGFRGTRPARRRRRAHPSVGGRRPHFETAAKNAAPEAVSGQGAWTGWFEDEIHREREERGRRITTCLKNLSQHQV